MNLLCPFAVVLIAAMSPLARAATDAPLELVATIPLPGVKGRIDHLAVDVKGRRLFVAALGNDTLEVIDTQANRRLKSLEGFGEPQGVLYLPTLNRVFVANGSASRVDILDGASFAVIERVAGLEDADNLRYDAGEGKVVVGYGRGALRSLDPATGASGGEIGLPQHPESFQLEQDGTRVFVNVPRARQIAVVDRRTRALIAAWQVPGAKANFPMALDEKGRRLFVGARSPAVMLIYDIDTGKVVARKVIGEDPDDLFFDRERRRIYIVCGTGHVEVFRQDSPDRYTAEEQAMTSPWARTGLFVPEESRLYVAGPAVGRWSAQIFVFRVR
jgi:DNA-binding beta-propeller fold protein YncE